MCSWYICRRYRFCPQKVLNFGKKVPLGQSLGLKIKHNTILIIDDRFGSLSYTTDLLKNGGLASIGPSCNKNTEVGTFVLLLEDPDMFRFHICLQVNLGVERQILTYMVCPHH